MFIGCYINIYDNIEFDNISGNFSYHLPEGISFNQDIFSSILAPLIGGLFGGTAMVFWLKNRLKDYSYGRLFFIHSLIYIVIILAVSLSILTINELIYHDIPAVDDLIKRNIRIIFTNPGIWKPVSFWYIIVMLTVLFLQVNEKYGEGILWNFITGKYHKPREEYRAFMFLDLKSSTTIAEKIGSNKYHLLLQHFFSDITSPIINNKGEIYQYIGDEVIVTWKIKNSEDIRNVINCYKQIKEAIQMRTTWYSDHFIYGPAFKAGIHSGYATVGEIGVIKKDLTYTGDVLNTTSRIMSKCSELNEDLLFSEDIYRCMQQESMEAKFVSETTLRGKSNSIRLYTI